MASNRVEVSQMARAITDAMGEFKDLSEAAMKDAVKETAKSVQKEIKANAPKDTGAYKKSWRCKITSQNSHKLVYTVYAGGDEYRLTHLLEFGHRKTNGGFVRAIPHIAPAEENGAAMLERLFKEAMNS